MFCKFYSKCLNPKEAAIKAGYPLKKAEKIALKLLNKKDVIFLIDNFQIKIKKEKILDLIILALKKIIFYRPNDTISLANKLNDMSETEIQTLDLFLVYEIKKLKDGSFEFKFLDKLKAIDTLLSLSEKVNSCCKANNFLEALVNNSDYSQNE